MKWVNYQGKHKEKYYNKKDYMLDLLLIIMIKKHVLNFFGF